MAINTKTYSDNKLIQQDDFRITEVVLYNYKGDAENLTEDVVAIDVFESIYNHTLTGKLTFTDQFSFVERMPIVGKEFLEFRLRTPIQYNGVYGGEINAVTHKFFVYKVSVEQATFRNQVVTLHFASAEMLRNNRVRVSKAYEGAYDKAVADIFKSSSILNSKKPLFLERTRLNQKVVIPNLRPFDAINMFCSRSLSTISNSASFFFYETTQGFHFRSLDSMVRDLKSGVGPSQSMFTYKLETSGMPNPSSPGEDAYRDLERVYSHKFNNALDTIADTRSGMMASKLITHDLYNKTFSTKEFNYAKDYFTLPHLENDNSLSEFPSKYSMIPESPADPSEDDTNKEGRNNIYTDYTDGVVMVQSTTANVHNTNLASGYHAENTLQSRTHSLEILKSLQLTITTPGNTHVNAGQVVNVTVPSYASEVFEKGEKQYNKFTTGRYLITDLRHAIDFNAQKHRTILTLSKETYGTTLVNSLAKPDIGIEDEQIVVELGVNKEYA